LTSILIWSQTVFKRNGPRNIKDLLTVIIPKVSHRKHIVQDERKEKRLIKI